MFSGQIKMSVDVSNNHKIEAFLAKYPGKIEFPRQLKEFEEAHAKLFELIEYIIRHTKAFTTEDEKFKIEWNKWKDSGLESHQSLTVVKRRMGLSVKECALYQYMKNMSTFPRLNQFVSMEYVTDPQPLIILTNKFSMIPKSSKKQG